jgi:hypothetical protein
MRAQSPRSRIDAERRLYRFSRSSDVSNVVDPQTVARIGARAVLFKPAGAACDNCARVGECLHGGDGHSFEVRGHEKNIRATKHVADRISRKPAVQSDA